ncbi:MAG: ABC transporter ATP-binding protein, partial [Chloroflexi bacterium]|nr:ABC transporter ATP-binding protein [Chloroflexota bacterium]
SLRYFDSKPHGELMSRLTNDVETISMMLNQSATQLISSMLTIIGVCFTMFAVNWRMALVTLVSVPMMAIVTRYIAKHTRRGYREQQATLGIMNGIIEETITGERVIKAYAREEASMAEFDVSNQAYVKAAIFAQTLSGVVGPLSGLINHLAYAIVALVGAVMAINGLATVGTIAIFINYSRELGRPLMMIANLLNTIQSSLAGAERIFEVLDEVPELGEHDDAVSLGDIAGDVVFDDVSFSYVDDVPVLKSVALHAEPGQTIALVGPTGAGKTTIVNLLTRFYDVDEGSIRLDGVDLRQIDRDSLRRAIALVLQDNFLFAQSVMENIRYGRLDATDEEVIAAARLANADHFIRRLPNGYQTELSERGSNLSQGQRQLLAIARAMLANPQILILDEATSSVDTRTEIHIQEALLRLMEGRTAFVIAHRLSTIRSADQVLVIDDGEIIERGTHMSLLAQRGFYYNLYMSQFKGHVDPVMIPAE